LFYQILVFFEGTRAFQVLIGIVYLLIAFSNSQGTLFEVQSQIFSNVPASSNCNFICPISNVKNPDLNFVSREREVLDFWNENKI